MPFSSSVFLFLFLLWFSTCYRELLEKKTFAEFWESIYKIVKLKCDLGKQMSLCAFRIMWPRLKSMKNIVHSIDLCVFSTLTQATLKLRNDKILCTSMHCNMCIVYFYKLNWERLGRYQLVWESKSYTGKLYLAIIMLKFKDKAVKSLHIT